jgi:hypothetical protein
MARLVICPECLAELEQFIDRAKTGDTAARKALRREREKFFRTVIDAVTHAPE